MFTERVNVDRLNYTPFSKLLTHNFTRDKKAYLFSYMTWSEWQNVEFNDIKIE